MRKRSVHQSAPLAGLGIEPMVRRVVRLVDKDDVERRLRTRKLPPIYLILVSLLLWVLIIWAGHALYQALT